MRVLLTGGAGFIGSHTAISLIENGHKPFVIDNLSNSSEEALRRVEKISGEKVPLFVGDCAVEQDIRAAFKKFSPIDAVIHFAGFKAVGESVFKPIEYYSNNLNATLALCKTMQEFDCHILAFSSSATVYGISSDVPYVETAPTGCINPYGWTKWMNEQIIKDITQSFNKQNKRFSAVLLRYFNPIGAHPSGKIGEDPAGVPNNLMPYICQTASGKRACLNIFGNDYNTKDGTGERDYIHVCDLAEGHLAALEYASGHDGVEIFNLGTGKAYSVLELIKTFEDVNQVKVPYRFVERRPGDIAACYADVSKAGKLLNWHAKRTLECMCRDAWNWQINNPNGYKE